MEPRDGRGPATSTGRRGSTHVERDSARVPRRCVPPDREGARHRPGPTIARMGDGDRADRLSRQWTHVPSFSPLSTRTGFPSTERVTWASPPSPRKTTVPSGPTRSEEHTSELQSRFDLVCRLLLEKKKKQRH